MALTYTSRFSDFENFYIKAEFSLHFIASSAKPIIVIVLDMPFKHASSPIFHALLIWPDAGAITAAFLYAKVVNVSINIGFSLHL